MAIIKPGPLVSEARGKIGGVVFARNKGGAYVRNFAAPTQVPTELRNEQRSTIAALTAIWNTELDSGQRDAWSDYGQSVGGTNSLGEHIVLSGIAAFVRGNSLRLRAGLAAREDGPASPTLGPSLTGGDFAVHNAAPDTTLEITSLTWSETIAAGGAVVVQVSNPVNAGRLSPAGAPMRTVGYITTGFTGIVEDLPDTAVGLGVFVRLRAVTVDGRIGAPYVTRVDATPV